MDSGPAGETAIKVRLWFFACSGVLKSAAPFHLLCSQLPSPPPIPTHRGAESGAPGSASGIQTNCLDLQDQSTSVWVRPQTSLAMQGQAFIYKGSRVGRDWLRSGPHSRPTGPHKLLPNMLP